MVALVIGLTAMLGLLALRLGGFVLSKPPPTQREEHLAALLLSGADASHTIGYFINIDNAPII